jgi:bifunctional non-homologous end joining protein LigD
MNTILFNAIQQGELDALQTELALKPDLTQKDAYGFAPLHRAAMASNSLDETTALAMLDALIKAGAPLELITKDGRTALYLAAEFSSTLAPLQILVNAGANPNISDGFGNHIVTNAMMEEVQVYLSHLTHQPLPIKPLELDDIKLSAAAWKAAKVHLDAAFEQLSLADILVLHNAGTTQEDGFSDANEALLAAQSQGKIYRGFCFYTSQDLNRAKRTSKLSLAFWGAPDGNEQSMLDVAQTIVEQLKQTPFVVDWNGSAQQRPMVYLQPV